MKIHEEIFYSYLCLDSNQASKQNKSPDFQEMRLDTVSKFSGCCQRASGVGFCHPREYMHTNTSISGFQCRGLKLFPWVSKCNRCSYTKVIAGKFPIHFAEGEMLANILRYINGLKKIDKKGRICTNNRVGHNHSSM